MCEVVTQQYLYVHHIYFFCLVFKKFNSFFSEFCALHIAQIIHISNRQHGILVLMFLLKTCEKLVAECTCFLLQFNEVGRKDVDFSLPCRIDLGLIFHQSEGFTVALHTVEPCKVH